MAWTRISTRHPPSASGCLHSSSRPPSPHPAPTAESRCETSAAPRPGGRRRATAPAPPRARQAPARLPARQRPGRSAPPATPPPRPARRGPEPGGALVRAHASTTAASRSSTSAAAVPPSGEPAYSARTSAGAARTSRRTRSASPGSSVTGRQRALQRSPSRARSGSSRPRATSSSASLTASARKRTDAPTATPGGTSPGTASSMSTAAAGAIASAGTVQASSAWAPSTGRGRSSCGELSRPVLRRWKQQRQLAFDDTGARKGDPESFEGGTQLGCRTGERMRASARRARRPSATPRGTLRQRRILAPEAEPRVMRPDDVQRNHAVILPSRADDTYRRACETSRGWPRAASVPPPGSRCSSPPSGRCAGCGEPLGPAGTRDHVEPVSAGGATEPANGQALCPRCNLAKGARRGVIAPRGWQSEFLARHAAHDAAATSCSSRRPARARRSPHARRCAPPARAARRRLSDDRAARAVGRRRRPRRPAPGPALAQRRRRLAHRHRRRRRHLPAGRVGARPVRPPPRAADVRRARRGPSRGRVRDLGHRAAGRVRRRRRIASRCPGTPFRSDARAIPFVRYDEERRCAPDFVYGYGEAVSDEVCRPLAFRLLDATLRWRVDAQETIAAFADELDPTDDARRLRTAIDPATPLLPQMLRDADALLTKARAVDPRRRRTRPLRRPRPRPRDGRAAAHDRRREARRGRQRRAAGARADRAVRARRRRRPALARRRQHGQRGRRRPAAGARRLRDRQAHRPVLPPGRRPRRAPPRRAIPTTSSRPSSCPPIRR